MTQDRMHSEFPESAEALLEEERQGEAYAGGVMPRPGSRTFYIESNGCQMNFSDSEIVGSLVLGRYPGIFSDIDSLLVMPACIPRSRARTTKGGT